MRYMVCTCIFWTIVELIHIPLQHIRCQVTHRTALSNTVWKWVFIHFLETMMRADVIFEHSWKGSSRKLVETLLPYGTFSESRCYAFLNHVHYALSTMFPANSVWTLSFLPLVLATHPRYTQNWLQKQYYSGINLSVATGYHWLRDCLRCWKASRSCQEAYARIPALSYHCRCYPSDNYQVVIHGKSSDLCGHLPLQSLIWDLEVR